MEVLRVALTVVFFSSLLVLSSSSTALGTKDESRNESRRWFVEVVAPMNVSFFLSTPPYDLMFHYAGGRLSKYFSSPRYLKVGACDGVSDVFIVHFTRQKMVWQNLLVEAVNSNFHYLNSFVDGQGNSKYRMRERTRTVHAAVSDLCPKKSVTVHVPKFEQLFPDLPHWLRRQLGSLHTPNMTYINRVLNTYPNHARAIDRTYEELFEVQTVPCVVASELLSMWGNPSLPSPSLSASVGLRDSPKRPHFLMVDAEGNDYRILKSLLSPDVPRYLLPLVIHAEIKSLLREEGEGLVKLLTSRGYIYSQVFVKEEGERQGELEGDVFAMLLPRQKSPEGKAK